MNEMNIRRIYVEKRKPFDIEAAGLFHDLKEYLGITNLTGVRVLKRYDVSGITDEEYRIARSSIFAEPPVDMMYDDQIKAGDDEVVIAVEYLPGQYDQRADSAAQCIQIITLKQKPLLTAARLVILKAEGELSREDLAKIRNYLINPVDSREAELKKPETLLMEFRIPEDVERLHGFIHLSQEQLEHFRVSRGLAMSLHDIKFCQRYFKDKEKRDPTITEIRVLDTYWSDHCRHTTFQSRIIQVDIEDSILTMPVKKAYEKYLDAYQYVYPDRASDIDISLMNIATMSMKEMKKRGTVKDQEVSGEVNACSIIREVIVNGKPEEWLIMFKNETHNHPTEIEPFGGAATCLGGAIRDPLSGRAFVYQAMRVTGCGNPLRKIEETLPGKLPQRKITTEAAHGYSSYGNQIGLPTGIVAEIYHDGYLAKRMEVGAVIGAVPRRNIIRMEPEPGDIILLIGGRTGRDGIGGATGSSKEHTKDSIYTAGAEVQKGNPPEERKLQRLYRNPEVCKLIKRSNDFGAGGVSVAIGELAKGLEIYLDRVPKKYEGLDGTELAISESQERMAVVVAPEHVEKFKQMAHDENLEATEIARVTSDSRLKMYWRDIAIVDISRDFIDTHGVRQNATIKVIAPNENNNYFTRIPSVIENALRQNDIRKAWLENLRQLNIGSQRGLGERFDSSVGGGTVLAPFGGKFQLSPIEAMAAKIPILTGDTTTASLMSFGFNPEISTWSPFHGAVYAVVEAAAKIVASGGEYRSVRATLQEYFEKLGTDSIRWGKPFSALLGAYHALTELGIASLGGKDSMSGSFMNLDVPPTLIAFAVDTADVDHVISPEFKKTGSRIVYIPMPRDKHELPQFDILKKNLLHISQLIKKKKVLAVQTVRNGGIAAALSRMAFGNKIGFQLIASLKPENLFSPEYGSFILEMEDGGDGETGKRSIGVSVKGGNGVSGYRGRGETGSGRDGKTAMGGKGDDILEDVEYLVIGHTIEESALKLLGEEIDMDEAVAAWEAPLEPVFPTRPAEAGPKPVSSLFAMRSSKRPAVKIAKPRVLIPVFPGTNCEYETQTALERAGAVVDIFVFRNLATSDINESLDELNQKINNSQIIVIPGGFSAGDEPDGSGKFISAVFRNPQVKDAVMNLLKQRDGLMLGICNGFQALIKLGLLPFGEIRDMDENSPTLTFNQIGRHMNRMVRTKIISVLSPWFFCHEPGAVHIIPSSHGEGRFIASPVMIQQLMDKGQIATQYVDLDGNPSMDIAHNPNGSMNAVEAITSPDGRILGKMAHTERISSHVAVNIPGDKFQKLFHSGILYFG